MWCACAKRLRAYPTTLGGGTEEIVPERYRNLFRLGHSVSGFWPVGGNAGRLLADSNATIDALVADIDAAKRHVHVLFYIWLADNNGRKVIEALKRAAARGVTCRVMVDDVGSRGLVRSPHWQAMREAGIKVASGLAIGNPLLRVFTSRIDLRNHRKIVVIDGRITYCGSQNCADPEFLVKARYAPWVDAMVRFEGPIAHQNQLLFAGDWMAGVQRRSRRPAPRAGRDTAIPTSMPAQVIGTGPTVRYSAMQEVFQSLLFAARREIVITTPYYVPDDSLQSALCATAYRGVDTTIIFPARNDSWIVAWASRSYYSDLLAAGVRIHEYEGGLLHTKSLTVDGELTLIGSANMDRRSMELNYENNILVYDRELTEAMRARQREYMERSRAGDPRRGRPLVDAAQASEQHGGHSRPAVLTGASSRTAGSRQRRGNRLSGWIVLKCPKPPTPRSAGSRCRALSAARPGSTDRARSCGAAG